MKAKSEHVARILLPALSVVLLFAFWSFYVRHAAVSAFVLPPPEKIVAAFFGQIAQASVWHHVAVTVAETLGGFFSALVTGVLLGTLLAKVPPLEWSLKPFVVVMQLVPKVALAPLFVLWFGFGLESKIVVSAVLAFFPIFANTLVAMKSVDAGDREVFASMRAGPWATFRLLEWPAALPFVLTGAEVAIVLAIIGAIVGEFIGGNEGLGYLAVARLQDLKVDALFAIILLLTLIGLVMYGAVALLRRWLAPWHQASAGQG